jgi:integrase
MSDRDLATETALFQRFLVWIYDSMATKRVADALPKQESALAFALAIKRAHARLGTETPPTRELRKVLHGLELAYVEEMGTAAFLPRRKSPLTAPMLHAILALRSFTVHGQPFHWSSPVGTSVRAMFLVMWRTGMRKDDAIRLRKAAAWVRPDGDFNLSPCSSKTDPLCKVWGLDVISLPAPCSDPLDASSGLHSLPRGGPKDALFPGADGGALNHALVDAISNAAALAALGPTTAGDLSTHSFRIGVATRLTAAGFSNEYIRRFGQWTTVCMVDIYARLFEGSFAYGHAALRFDEPVGPAARTTPAAPRQQQPNPGAPAASPPP